MSDNPLNLDPIKARLKELGPECEPFCQECGLDVYVVVLVAEVERLRALLLLVSHPD